MQKLKQLYQRLRHFILYGLIGTFSTGLEFVVYWLLLRITPYFLANVVGFHCGILCSFLLNRKYNFNTEDHTVLRFVSFYFVQIICLALNSTFLLLFVEIMGFEPLIGKAIATLLTALLPFFLNKFITFRKAQ